MNRRKSASRLNFSISVQVVQDDLYFLIGNLKIPKFCKFSVLYKEINNILNLVP
nr:MAG TPA: hypothetical protein [Caudoviricetes sp.]